MSESEFILSLGVLCPVGLEFPENSVPPWAIAPTPNGLFDGGTDYVDEEAARDICDGLRVGRVNRGAD